MLDDESHHHYKACRPQPPRRFRLSPMCHLTRIKYTRQRSVEAWSHETGDTASPWQTTTTLTQLCMRSNTDQCIECPWMCYNNNGKATWGTSAKRLIAPYRSPAQTHMQEFSRFRSNKPRCCTGLGGCRPRAEKNLQTVEVFHPPI